MRTVKTSLLVFLCTALLGACGLKGPLYLPEDNPAAEKATAADKDGNEKKVKDKKDDNGTRPAARH
ncbi:MAG: lipoprotein [Lysobacterales bacterium]